MLILKYLLLGIILFSSSYIGIIKAKTFENRVKELNKFQNALLMFKSKIEFTYEPIKNIFEEISKIIYQNEENIFLNSINISGSITLAWNKAVENIKSDFKDEDKEIIKMFGKLLGKIDLIGQVNEIDLTMKLIEKQIEKAETEKNQNTKLYKTMGIVLGMGICIIVI